jgi:hypothetical protein
MKDVAGLELVAGGAQDLLAGELRRGRQQGEHVLDLVAKAVGAAGLI